MTTCRSRTCGTATRRRRSPSGPSHRAWPPSRPSPEQRVRTGTTRLRASVLTGCPQAPRGVPFSSYAGGRLALMSATQLGFTGMPTRLFTCTPSRLATWLDCPRRYKFVYVDRPSPPKGPPWAHNSLGAAVHTALAAWWDLPVARRTPESAATLLRSRWIALGFRDDEQSATWRERAADMVAGYVARVDPHCEPLGVERTVAMRTERIAVSGRIDRLDRR